MPEINLRNLAVIQVFLGLLVVVSFFAFSGWLAGGYYVYEGTIPGTDTIVRTNINPEQVPLIDIWYFVFLALGSLVVIGGIWQFVKAWRFATGQGGLAVVQIIFGVVIFGLLIWYIVSVEPEYGSYTQLIEGVEVNMHTLPGWNTGLIVWKAVSFLLGLVIIGTGAIQYRITKG